MIGLFLFYAIGKSYYNLAGNYAKNKWGYAILGILAYYMGALIGGVLIGLFALIAKFNLEDTPDMVFNLMALPIGILSCWGLYKWLERQWTKDPTRYSDGTILDEDLAKDNWAEQ